METILDLINNIIGAVSGLLYQPWCSMSAGCPPCLL